MKNALNLLLLSLCCFSLPSHGASATQSNTDGLFSEIQRTTDIADFDAMAKLYHPDAMLVTTAKTEPISRVLPRWKASAERLKQAGGHAHVAFRFSSRITDATSALDKGIFKYTVTNSTGVTKSTYRFFENLSILKSGHWSTLVERQLIKARESDWNKLGSQIHE